MNVMDYRDEAIIKALEKASRLSSRAIAREVNLPISTVHRKIKKMEQEGVIIGYKARINYEKTSWPIGAYIFINLEEHPPKGRKTSKENVIDILKSFEEVKELAEVQGTSFNLIAKARFRSLKDLSTFIDKLRALDSVEEVSQL